MAELGWHLGAGGVRVEVVRRDFVAAQAANAGHNLHARDSFSVQVAVRRAQADAELACKPLGVDVVGLAVIGELHVPYCP